MEEADKLTTIGHLFETGEVFEKDYKMALECYTAASSYGNSMAVNNLGWLAQNGFGTKKDIASAVEMYELGVKLNNPISMVNLGNIYERGLLNGIPDYEKACKYYKMAADLGNQDGLFNYANCLFYGWGHKKIIKL